MCTELGGRGRCDSRYLPKKEDGSGDGDPRAGRPGRWTDGHSQPAGSCGLRTVVPLTWAHCPPTCECPDWPPHLRREPWVPSPTVQAPLEPGWFLALTRKPEGGGGTFTSPAGVAPEDTVLLFDEMPAQNDVLPLLRVLPAHPARSWPSAPWAQRTVMPPPGPHHPPQPPGCPALTGSGWRAHK